MQSVYKLPIAMAMLHEVDLRAFSLDQKIRFLPSDRISPDQHSPLRDGHPHGDFDVSLRELLRLAVSESDGVASDILVRELGGPANVDSYIRGLGIHGIRIADTEKTLGVDLSAQYRNYSEPAAMVALLERLSEKSPLSTDSTHLLMRWMTESSPGSKRLRGLLPPGTVVAHKTGTSGTDNGITHATNDVGIVTLPDGRHLYIAVFVCDSPESESVREAVIAKIAKEVYSLLPATLRSSVKRRSSSVAIRSAVVASLCPTRRSL